MFKFLKKLFKAQDKESVIQECEDEYRKRLDDEYNHRKSEWQTKNELAKKHDACNLGMTRTAFYGTYEEYLSKTNNNRLYDLSQMHQLAATALNAQTGQYNPYSGSIFH